MKQLTFRLKPGELLKENIEARTKDIKAGVLLSIVGGLENAVLRMAGSTPDKQIIKENGMRGLRLCLAQVQFLAMDATFTYHYQIKTVV